MLIPSGDCASIALAVTLHDHVAIGLAIAFDNNSAATIPLFGSVNKRPQGASDDSTGEIVAVLAPVTITFMVAVLSSCSGREQTSDGGDDK